MHRRTVSLLGITAITTLVTVETDPFKQLNELFAGNGMIGFVAKERVDGKLVLPEAVQIMKLKAD